MMENMLEKRLFDSIRKNLAPKDTDTENERVMKEALAWLVVHVRNIETRIR